MLLLLVNLLVIVLVDDQIQGSALMLFSLIDFSLNGCVKQMLIEG